MPSAEGSQASGREEMDGREGESNNKNNREKRYRFIAGAVRHASIIEHKLASGIESLAEKTKACRAEKLTTDE